MNRGTFSNNKKGKNNGVVDQNFQQNLGKSENNKNRKKMREKKRNGNVQYDLERPHLLSSPTPYQRKTSSYNRQTPPLRLDSPDVTERFAELHMDENSFRTPESPMEQRNKCRITTLPAWVLDENLEIRTEMTLKAVVDEDMVVQFALDKSGCHFLQINYYGEHTKHVDPKIREKITRAVLENRDVFMTLCRNMFGNFFLQRVVEYSDAVEQEVIKRYIMSDIESLCLDKSACRVVQTALDTLEPRYTDAIVGAIPRKQQLTTMCNDQNANHVIQKVVETMPLNKWEFLVVFLCKNDFDNLAEICQDKYGCRVVQTMIEVLVEPNIPKTKEADRRRVLNRLMQKILSRCQDLSINEFANYIIQHIIETPVLSFYRDAIIEKCLLRNLLSMSQEKYASHVVERALVFAAPDYVIAMLDEIFDGYLPHPTTKKDALDIMLFHQFANYVVQRVLQICVNCVLGKRDTVINGQQCRPKFEAWLRDLYVRAKHDKARLERFSSGKKIIEILDSIEGIFALPAYTRPSRRHHQIGSASVASTSSPFYWPPSTSSHDFSDNFNVDYGFSRF